MFKITLTQNKIVLVDKNDFEQVSRFKWYAYTDGFNWYAARMSRSINNKRKILRMHTEILKPKKGFEVDHINRNGLDNRRKNLRVVTHQKNCMNRGVRKDNTSGIRGVSWNKNEKKWVSRIVVNKQRVFIGYFNSKELAHNAYKKYAQQIRTVQ